MARVAAIVGLALYIVVAAFPFGASGLLAPLWGIALLFGLWGMGLVLTVKLYRERSPWTLAMPVGAVAVWFAVMWLGESAFGWTA